MLKLSKIILNILIITFFLGLTLIWLRKNDLFVVDNVKVVGNSLLTREETIELANIDFSKEIFHIDLRAIEDRLLANELIEKVSVSRYLPSAIKIKIEEKDLIATIADKKLIALESNGGIVNTDRLTALYDLPVITGAHLVTDSAGTKFISEPIVEMVQILKALRSINLQVYHDLSEIHYDQNSGIILYLREKPIPIILGFHDYARKIYYLTTMYDLLKKRNELLTLSSIDIRFAGQVVVRN